mgnify:FL=1
MPDNSSYGLPAGIMDNPYSFKGIVRETGGLDARNGRAVMIRFEHGYEGRISKEYGPFPFVQLTYELLRVGPDGEDFAIYDGTWHLTTSSLDENPDPEIWSDVIIYSFDGP